MPASYHISRVISCIITRLEDSVIDDDLLEGQRRMFSDPLFKGHYSRLVDATEVTEFAVSAETVTANRGPVAFFRTATHCQSTAADWQTETASEHTLGFAVLLVYP